MVSFGKKSKKEPTSSEAAVSSIPVPPAENSLVIDLPEGQKLVLGRMEDGTVIEVATWRGTGRPDSRTNRLMLGVSSTVSPSTSSEPTQKEESTINLAERIRNLLLINMTRLFGFLRTHSLVLISKVKARILKKDDLRPTLDVPADESRKDTGKGIEDFEFDKWLQSIERALPNDEEVAAAPKNLSAKTSRSDQVVKRVGDKVSPRGNRPIKKSQKRK